MLHIALSQSGGEMRSTAGNLHIFLKQLKEKDYRVSISVSSSGTRRKGKLAGRKWDAVYKEWKDEERSRNCKEGHWNMVLNTENGALQRSLLQACSILKAFTFNWGAGKEAPLYSVYEGITRKLRRGEEKEDKKVTGRGADRDITDWWLHKKMKLQQPIERQRERDRSARTENKVKNRMEVQEKNGEINIKRNQKERWPTCKRLQMESTMVQRGLCGESLKYFLELRGKMRRGVSGMM